MAVDVEMASSSVRPPMSCMVVSSGKKKRVLRHVPNCDNRYVTIVGRGGISVAVVPQQLKCSGYFILPKSECVVHDRLVHLSTNASRP